MWVRARARGKWEISLPGNYFGNNAFTPNLLAILAQAVTWSIWRKVIFEGLQYPADEVAGFRVLL